MSLKSFIILNITFVASLSSCSHLNSNSSRKVANADPEAKVQACFQGFDGAHGSYALTQSFEDEIDLAYSNSNEVLTEQFTRISDDEGTYLMNANQQKAELVLVDFKKFQLRFHQSDFNEGSMNLKGKVIDFVQTDCESDQRIKYLNKKRILLAAQFSLISELHALRSFGESQEDGLPSDLLRVLVWNVKKGQEKGLDVDLPRLSKDKDLILISEGYLSKKVKPIFESIPVRWDMGVSFLYKKDNDFETGTLIGSKVKPSFVQVKHTVDFEPFIRTPKAVTFGTYPIKRRKEQLLAVSIHGINLVGIKKFKRHLELIRPEIQNHKGPVLFGGDFNTNLKKKTKFMREFAESLGLKEISFRNDKRMKVLGQKIDFIFTKKMSLIDSEVLGEIRSSDHKPLVASFKIDD